MNAIAINQSHYREATRTDICFYSFPAVKCNTLPSQQKSRSLLWDKSSVEAVVSITFKFSITFIYSITFKYSSLEEKYQEARNSQGAMDNQEKITDNSLQTTITLSVFLNCFLETDFKVCLSVTARLPWRWCKSSHCDGEIQDREVLHCSLAGRISSQSLVRNVLTVKISHSPSVTMISCLRCCQSSETNINDSNITDNNNGDISIRDSNIADNII